MRALCSLHPIFSPSFTPPKKKLKADFHSNQLSGPVPIEALAQARLTFLNLSSNVWGRHGGKEGVDAVRRGLPNCRAVVM